jgi:hypothetical protein
MTREERWAMVILDTMELIRIHISLLPDEEEGEALLVEVDALQAMVAARSEPVGWIDALGRAVRRLRVLADAADHPAADTLRRREDGLMRLRDKRASYIAQQGR